jgi:hypothetical protein
MANNQFHFDTINKNPSATPFPQEPLWDDTLDVIFKLANIESNQYTASEIAKVLRFNSEETRQRYGNAIYRRLFGHDELYGKTLINVARYYNDPVLVETLWRTIYFLIEPIPAKTYLDIIWLRTPGSMISSTEIKNYVRSQWKSLGAKVDERVSLSLKHSGVIRKHEKKFVISGFANLETSLLLMVHLLYVKESSAVTVSMTSIENNNFWKYLGYRSLDHVRVALRKAEHQGLLARYAIVDHIEQITTKYSLSSLISMKLQI